MNIQFLQAFNGDAILLTYALPNGDIKNILIDGGIGKTYFEKAKKKVQFNDLHSAVEIMRKAEQKIDLLILTHVDDDHIGGLLKWFKYDAEAFGFVEKIWFNSGRLIKEELETDKSKDYDNSLDMKVKNTNNTSIVQGVKFEDKIKEKAGLWDEKLFKSGDHLNFLGLDFTFLSPNDEKLKLLLGKWEKEAPILPKTSTTNDYGKSLEQHIAEDVDYIEDNAIHNGSSIAFFITYESTNFLFLADAHPSVICEALEAQGYSEANPFPCALVKVSHHGSKSNNDTKMLKMISSNRYIISTNGDKHAHPHKRFLARLINLKPSCEIYFNYPERIGKIFSSNDFEKYKFKALGLEDFNKKADGNK